MKLTIHKETLYLMSTILASLAIALSVVSNLGTSVYSVPAIALSAKISSALPTSWNVGVRDVLGSQAFSELIINSSFLVCFCLLIRKFRPYFLLSFLTTFLFAVFLYGFQWIPAFWPEINHHYPLYVRIIMLSFSIIVMALAVACSFKGYLYPPMITFVQKGIAEHYKIKNGWIVVFVSDIVFATASIFIIYGIYHDWQFWNYNLSYGSLISAVVSGPIIGLFIRLFNQTIETKTLFPAWEKALAIENKKGL